MPPPGTKSIIAMHSTLSFKYRQTRSNINRPQRLDLGFPGLFPSTQLKDSVLLPLPLPSCWTNSGDACVCGCRYSAKLDPLKPSDRLGLGFGLVPAVTHRHTEYLDSVKRTCDRFADEAWTRTRVRSSSRIRTSGFGASQLARAKDAVKVEWKRGVVRYVQARKTCWTGYVRHLRRQKMKRIPRSGGHASIIIFEKVKKRMLLLARRENAFLLATPLLSGSSPSLPLPPHSLSPSPSPSPSPIFSPRLPSTSSTCSLTSYEGDVLNDNSCCPSTDDTLSIKEPKKTLLDELRNCATNMGIEIPAEFLGFVRVDEDEDELVDEDSRADPPSLHSIGKNSASPPEPDTETQVRARAGWVGDSCLSATFITQPPPSPTPNENPQTIPRNIDYDWSSGPDLVSMLFGDRLYEDEDQLVSEESRSDFPTFIQSINASAIIHPEQEQEPAPLCTAPDEKLRTISNDYDWSSGPHLVTMVFGDRSIIPSCPRSPSSTTSLYTPLTSNPEHEREEDEKREGRSVFEAMGEGGGIRTPPLICGGRKPPRMLGRSNAKVRTHVVRVGQVTEGEEGEEIRVIRVVIHKKAQICRIALAVEELEYAGASRWVVGDEPQMMSFSFRYVPPSPVSHLIKKRQIHCYPGANMGRTKGDNGIRMALVVRGSRELVPSQYFKFIFVFLKERAQGTFGVVQLTLAFQTNFWLLPNPTESQKVHHLRPFVVRSKEVEGGVCHAHIYNTLKDGLGYEIVLACLGILLKKIRNIDVVPVHCYRVPPVKAEHEHSIVHLSHLKGRISAPRHQNKDHSTLQARYPVNIIKEFHTPTLKLHPPAPNNDYSGFIVFLAAPPGSLRHHADGSKLVQQSKDPTFSGKYVILVVCVVEVTYQHLRLWKLAMYQSAFEYSRDFRTTTA